MATLAEVNVKIGADIRQFQRGLRSAERDLIRTGKALTSIGSNLSKSLTLPIAGAAAAAFKLSADFETSFTKIKTLVGIGGAQLDNFRKGISELSGPLGASQKDLSDALFVITSAGLRGDEAMQALEQASKATSIGLGETSDVARVAAAAVTAYGDAGLTSGAAIDQLTAIVREGNLEASELAPALGKVLPVASQMGVSFAEVGASVAAFSKLGVSAGESVSGLKALLANILKPSADAAKEFDRIGISADDLRKSIKEKGLAATLQELVSAYGDNTEGLSKIIPSVEGLAVALGTAGAQGEDYVGIVNRIAKSNGIVNKGFEDVSQTANFKLNQALVGLKNSASQFGSVIIPVITGILDKVNPLIQGFSNLGDGQKDLVVKGALVAASLGPILSISGGLITNFATLRKAVQGVVGVYSIAAQGFAAARSELLEQGVAMSGLTVRIKAARAAFSALNAAQKATVIGLVVAGIGAAVVAFQAYNAELTTTEKIQKNVADIQASALKDTASLRGETSALVSTIQKENTTLLEKERALGRLREINPQYFNDLVLENGEVKGLTQANNLYTESILKSARAKAERAKIDELEGAKLGLEQELKELTETTGIAKYFNEFTSGMVSTADLADELKGKIEDITAQQTALAENIAEGVVSDVNTTATVTTDIEAPTDGGLGINTSGAANADAEAEALERLKQKRAEYIDVAILGNEALSETNVLSETAISLEEAQAAGFESAAERQTEFLEAYELETEARARRVEQLDKEAQKIATLSAVGQAMGQAITEATASGEKGFGKLAIAAVAAAGKIIKAEIAKGVAAAVSNALGTGPAGLILAPIAGAAAGALFQGLLNKITVPALAQGGLAYGPTLAVVGDNVGASSNPEVIAPLDKLKSIMKDSGGGGAVQVYGRLDGNDILISSQRAGSSQRRKSGYR